MLLRYIVSNYKSIGHPIEFSMMPTDDSIPPRFYTEIETKMGKWKVLRRGGFFGPNAAGKSSFIQSLRFAKRFITDGRKSGSTTGVIPFRGDMEELKEESTFQFVLYTPEEKDVYEYGFTLNRKYVKEEWLAKLYSTGFKTLFTRATDEAGKTEISIESAFARENSNERKLIDLLTGTMNTEQKNQLFLYKLYDNGVKRVKPVIDWFDNLQIIFPDTEAVGLPFRIKEDDKFRDFIAKGLKNLDTGVNDIASLREKIDFYDYAEKMGLSDEEIAAIENIKKGIVNIGGKYFIFNDRSENGKHNAVLYQLEFEHLLNGKSVNFELKDESDGTQRLTDLLPMLYNVQQDLCQIYFVDEIDRSLHTKITKYLIGAFSGEDDITSQLIFTAHDVNLIDLNSLSQEEIWFIEKNKMGESTIRPLSDFKLSDGQDTLKAYLSGRFGAVPVIRGDM